VLNGDWRRRREERGNWEKKEAGREREKKGRVEERENENFLLIFEFVEELQCLTNLLSTVAPHHFAEQVVELDGEGF
jgi:hypothetical protein